MTIEDAPRIDTTTQADLSPQLQAMRVDPMDGTPHPQPEPAGRGRRRLLASLGYGAGGLAASTVIACGWGRLLAGLLSAPANADTALDVQILQTASSLEALAVATYALALGQGPDGTEAPALNAVAGIPVTGARDTVTTIAMETMRQHSEHKKAFQALTTALDPSAKVQDGPNPKFLAHLARADLATADGLLDFAALLEKVATDTYLLNLTQVQDARAKALVAAVMAVEAQHLATLRAVAALLRGGSPQLVAVPLPLTAMKDLPNRVAGAAFPTLAFPDALEKLNGPDLVAEPSSGALK